MYFHSFHFQKHFSERLQNMVWDSSVLQKMNQKRFAFFFVQNTSSKKAYFFFLDEQTCVWTGNIVICKNRNVVLEAIEE